MIEQELIEQFYKTKYYISYSALSKLRFSPKLFFTHYILQQKEESVGAHLVEGRLIHCLLLQPELYEDQFYVAKSKLPSDNLKDIVDKIFKEHNCDDLSNYQDEILNILIEKNLYQTLKTDKQRLEKVITPITIDYLNDLVNSTGKSVIDQSTFDKCTRIVAKFKAHPDVIQHLGLELTEFDNCKVYRELEASCDLVDYKFGIKGILDTVIVDDVNKVIKIADVKTTSKTIPEFKESVEYYNYWMQAAMYVLLAKCYFMKLDYTYEFSFVVVDKYEQMYCFQVSPLSLDEWNNRFKEALNQAHYHYENRDYSLPYDYIVNKIML
ncbi:MAG: hypothetical protein EBR34_15865 [Sphingomonadaceae bacterium]|nr:hypothetical protein [Sphingomonadaceae bacterium]